MILTEMASSIHVTAAVLRCVLCWVLCAVLSVVCGAAEFLRTKGAEYELTALDADGDGKITKAEWMAK